MLMRRLVGVVMLGHIDVGPESVLDRLKRIIPRVRV